MLLKHPLHGPLDFAGQQPFQVARFDTGQFGEAQAVLRAGLGLLGGQQCCWRDGWQRDGLRPEFCQLPFQWRTLEQVAPRLGRIMDDDIIHPVACVQEQSPRVRHALGVVGRKQEEGQSHVLFGADIEHLQFLQCRHDERVRLGARVNDMNWRGVFEHSPKKTQQGRLALVLIAELIRADGVLVPTGKRMMPVVEVGAVPLDA